jgi:hypothetical protein
VLASLRAGYQCPDLTAAKRYYDQIMPTVGFEQHVTVQDQLAYRPAAGKPGTYVFFYPAADPRYTRCTGW